jgi:hypothetical protein
MPTGVYTHHVPEHVGLNYQLDISGLRDGWNEIVVYDGAEDASPQTHHADCGVRICGLELAVG